MIPASSAIKIPLTSEAHDAAEAVYQKQPPSRRQQTYLNLLAVHAVKHYLQWLSISTNWSGSDSHNPTLQHFLDVADLQIPGYGRLECRPVLPGATVMGVPSEVQSDRIGYVAVQFDEDLETAILLGFAHSVSQSQIPLSALEPIEGLLDLVGKAPVALSPTVDVPEELLTWQEPTPLGEWLNQKVIEIAETGWQTLEEIERLISPEAHPEFAFSVRGATSVRSAATALPVKRGKLVGFDKGSDHVALVVGLHEMAPPDTEISVEVYPIGEQGYLPKNLELMVLDEKGIAVMQAQARSNKKIQMEFSGEPGEEFSIRLAMGEFIVTEAFRL